MLLIFFPFLSLTYIQKLTSVQLNAFQSLVVRLSDDSKKVDEEGIATIVHVLNNWHAKNVFPGTISFTAIN
jgi:hypothetical protein